MTSATVPFCVQMLSERDAVVRQSSVLLSSATSDQRLMRALQEIEALTKQLKVTEDKHASQVGVVRRYCGSYDGRTYWPDVVHCVHNFDSGLLELSQKLSSC